MYVGIVCLFIGFFFGIFFGFRVGTTQGSIRGRADAYREIVDQEDKYPRVHR